MASNRSNNRTRRTVTMETNDAGVKVNRNWNNRKGEFKPAAPPAATPVVAARKKLHEVARCQPERTRRVTYNVFSPDGGNWGGNCLGCGAELGYWLHYKRCDLCLNGMRPASVQKRMGQ